MGIPNKISKCVLTTLGVLGLLLGFGYFAIVFYETPLDVTLRTNDGFSVRIRSKIYFDDVVGARKLTLYKNEKEIISQREIGAFTPNEVSKERRRKFSLLDTKDHSGFVVIERSTDPNKSGTPILVVQRDPFAAEFDPFKMAQSQIFVKAMNEIETKLP